MKHARWHKHLRHAVIHLPPLGAEQALDVITFLEKVLKAIWRAHGDAIADYQGMMGIETPKPLDARSEWPAKKSDDIF